MRNSILVIGLLTIISWLSQALLIDAPGCAGWSWDWAHHAGMSQRVCALLAAHQFPWTNGRTTLMGAATCPIQWLIPGYIGWQIGSVLVSTTALLSIAFLWGQRFGNARNAVLAVALCAGFAHSSTFTWPKLWVGSLILFALWCWAELKNWKGSLLLGVCLFVAFQAHQLAALYAAAFFLVLGLLYLASLVGFGKTRFPFVAFFVFVALLSLWMYGKIVAYGFDQAIYDNQYFGWDRPFAVYWDIFVRAMKYGTLPMAAYGAISTHGLAWINTREHMGIIERAFVDVFVPSMPFVAIIGLAWFRPRGRNLVCLVALLLGFLLVSGTQEGSNGGLGQASAATFLMFMVIAGSASYKARWRWPWAVSWLVYVVLVVAMTIEQAYFPDPYNAKIKVDTGYLFLRDLTAVDWLWIPFLASTALLTEFFTHD